LALLIIAGCGPRHEDVVRGRARELITLLLQENYGSCAELTDPGFIRQHGTEGAKLRFRIMGAFAKIGNITEEKVRIDAVTVDSDSKTATVGISILTGEEWKPLDPQRWVRVDGNWYVTF
jgi:hypothetical protein